MFAGKCVRHGKAGVSVAKVTSTAIVHRPEHLPFVVLPACDVIIQDISYEQQLDSTRLLLQQTDSDGRV